MQSNRPGRRPSRPADLVIGPAARGRTIWLAAWLTQRGQGFHPLLYLLYEQACRLPRSRGDGRSARFLRHARAGADFIEYLEAGETINDFLEGFPSVTREQVIAFLEEAKDRLVESVS